MRKKLTNIATLASSLAIAGAVTAWAQTPPATDDTYTWHAEFVAADTTAKTLTVKPRVAYEEALTELKQFKGGDRVWIFWSGVHNYSDAVRNIRRPGTGKIAENLVLPAELVSAEAPNQYITIRVKVPDSAFAAIKAVKPGEWVTITSRHQPANDDAAVVAVRPYVSTTSTD